MVSFPWVNAIFTTERSIAAGPTPAAHLADLDPAARRAAVAELGRASPSARDQLSRHYFGRLHRRPGRHDRPARRRSREALAAELLPRLLTAERELSCDNGATRKTLWRLFDGALVESVLMSTPTG